jgi:hypothetical protein
MSTGTSAGAKPQSPDTSEPGTSAPDSPSADTSATGVGDEPRAVPGVDPEQNDPQLAGPTDVQARLVYPPVTEEVPSSRPVLVVALVALLLLIAVGVILVRHGVTSDSGTDTGSGAGAPTRGVGADVVSEASFGPGLVVSQSQHVVFSEPVANFTLTVPKQVTTVSGGAFHPRIGNLQVLLGDGAPINVRQSLRPGSKVTVDLPGPTTRLDIVYVAYGAVVRSQPSSQHRAIALVNPLTLSPRAGMASTLHVDGTNVTNIGCTRPGGASWSCGAESAHGWTVTRGPNQEPVAVVAQLDLQG